MFQSRRKEELRGISSRTELIELEQERNMNSIKKPITKKKESPAARNTANISLLLVPEFALL